MRKVCSKCKQEKLLTEFNKRLNYKGINVGSSYCKVCVVEGRREWAVRTGYDNSKACKEYRRVNSKQIKEYERKYRLERQSKTNFKYCVYLLPEEHYCGKSIDPVNRKVAHKSNGKITDGFEIVMWFEKEKDALKLERCFHKLGWLGADGLQQKNFNISY